jgi:hypothetical protein
MIVGDVLQRVLDALDEIFLADRSHGRAFFSASGAERNALTQRKV